MVKYIANKCIGKYNPGNEVTEEDFLKWTKAYITVPITVVDEDQSKPEEKKGKNLFDLNRDGKVDKEDVKVAAKTLRKIGSRFKKGRKK